MPATVNEWLQEEAIRHAVELRGYGNGVVRRVIARLNSRDRQLFAELMDAIEKGNDASFSVARLERLLSDVKAINTAAFNEAERDLTAELSKFVEYELMYQQQALAAALPPGVATVQVSVAQVYSAAVARPFMGVLLKGALDDLDAQRAKLIERTIARGYVESKTTDQIVRELRGTRAAGYADGLMNRSRRDVQAIVRTALGNYAGVTQDSVMAANADLLKGVMWLATLDGRTTPECRIRDGLLYSTEDHEPIGHSIPWLAGPGRLHWNCRSVDLPVVKSWREMGIDMDEAPEGTRASMDGQVPASTTYMEWLSKKHAGIQDEVLGPMRGRLFREGNLPLRDMYTNDGRWMTLDQLRERDAQAFKRAGL